MITAEAGLLQVAKSIQVTRLLMGQKTKRMKLPYCFLKPIPPLDLFTPSTLRRAILLGLISKASPNQI